METRKESPANQAKISRLDAVWTALLREVLEHGFHGRACVELMIQGGTIQRICRLVERIEK